MHTLPQVCVTIYPPLDAQPCSCMHHHVNPTSYMDHALFATLCLPYLGHCITIYTLIPQSVKIDPLPHA